MNCPFLRRVLRQFHGDNDYYGFRHSLDNNSNIEHRLNNANELIHSPIIINLSTSFSVLSAKLNTFSALLTLSQGALEDRELDQGRNQSRDRELDRKKKQSPRAP
ncbi:hypothetical protein PRIPAC_73055 [Pristionchus pacificus]|uniref:Uncharacterized protein n=1 Tax=Pristionchus pacificus TaxID=54126 RepID=A0A2A6C7W3_PRIPA|nr:hypothetical protein PRIPAC_73055 [Pristionchus pacificus]|eukprot:PDM74274.1 hypothetical protein PRIPAC_41630 [Pristionchus pacificus]